MVEIAKRRKQIETKRVCSKCGSDKTRIYRNKLGDGTYGLPYPMWHRDGERGLFCYKCYLNNYMRRNPKYSRTKINYKGKMLLLKSKEIARRIGVCNWCRAVVGLDCKTTHLHHEEYDDNDPLAHTIELCGSCHASWHSLVRRRF